MIDIHWPTEHAVAGADIHAVNSATSTACAQRVRHLARPWPELRLGSRFSWITLAAPVTTTVDEYEPFERLAWSGTGPGARGHHAWLLRRAPGGGCEILTEETQHGLPVRILRPVLRPAMQRQHQRWVDALGRCAGRHRAQRGPALCAQRPPRARDRAESCDSPDAPETKRVLSYDH